MASTVLLLAALATAAQAHMSPYHPSMYGVGEYFDSSEAGDPFAPLGPFWEKDDWWFRGPTARSLKPAERTYPTGVLDVPAGGTITLEIACHVAWTSYGWATTEPGSDRDACPGNTGAYHSGDPNADEIDPSLLSGCALAIADKENIEDVGWDDLVVFSVQEQCVKQKYTDFQVPAKMPKCTGSKCICGWFWLANNGKFCGSCTTNFYMTAMDCAVSGSPADALPIAAPQDPVFCADWSGQSPYNVPFISNDWRAGYHETWSFRNGAQNDIFVTAGSSAAQNSTTASAVAASSTTAASSTAAASSTVASFSSLPGSSTVLSSSVPASSTAHTSSGTSPTGASSTALSASASISAHTASSSDLAHSSAALASTAVSSASSSSSSLSSESASASSVASAATSSSSAAETEAAASPSASSSTPPVNLARQAKASASSYWSASPPAAAIDGVVSGNLIPGGKAGAEWASRGGLAGSWIRLTWTEAVSFNQIVLYDRPNTKDQITSGTITFSDGTSISFGELDDTATAPSFLNLTSTVSTSTLTLKVTGVSSTTQDVGLAELEVYLADSSEFGSSALKPRSLRARHVRDFSSLRDVQSPEPSFAAAADNASAAAAADSIAQATIEAPAGLAADSLFEESPTVEMILQDEE
ncbi:hypothetical protein JCM10213v2_003113 [Rhodosporidiobolus nylandii]